MRYSVRLRTDDEGEKITKVFREIALPIFILSGILVILFYLRMVPAINNKVEFILDCSFNYRMTKEVIENGDVPSVDKLSTYSIGKDIKSLLPTAMYHISASFHNLLNRFKSFPLERSILIFCAFCGSLIAFPAYFISYEIYHKKTIAYLTALLAGIMPAYLNRSLCYWYRYEVAAVPLLFASLLFFIKAFKTREVKKILIYSLISLLFLLAALYIWRLAILFLMVYTISFVYLWLKERKFFVGWFIIPAALVAIYILLLWLIPGFGFKNPTTDYGSFPKAAMQIFLNNIGVKQAFSDFTRLVYHNQELGGVSLYDMFGRLFLSLSGIFPIVYIFGYFTRKKDAADKDILFVFLIFFLMLTFVFSRNKGVLGPLTAITLGESVEIALTNRKRILRGLLLFFLVIAFIKTGYDSYRLASTRYVNTKLHPNLKQALAAIDKLTPKDAVIASFWADGYPIQTYCNRPTITDGLFESPEIVKRIIEEGKAYYSYSEDELLDFCKRYGATHLLVPSNRKMAYAGYAGADFKRYYKKGGPTPMAKLTTLYKLIHAPNEIKKFHRLFNNKEFGLYAVE